MNTPRTQRLIGQTSRRLYLARFGFVFHRAGLIAAGVALLVVILCRLLSVFPSAIVIPWLWVLAIAALLATCPDRSPPDC
jgi:hypothetical protein